MKSFIRKSLFIYSLLLLVLIRPSHAANEVSLRDYVDNKIMSHQREVAQRFELQEKALELHSVEMERRLAGLNELRAEVIKDRSQFESSEVADANWKNFETWKLSISERLTAIETRSVVWTSVIGLFFAILQIVLFIWGRKQRWNDIEKGPC